MLNTGTIVVPPALIRPNTQYLELYMKGTTTGSLGLVQEKLSEMDETHLIIFAHKASNVFLRSNDQVSHHKPIAIGLENRNGVLDVAHPPKYRFQYIYHYDVLHIFINE